MTSSSEAFVKFSTWKNFKTSLKVTVIVSGKIESVVSGFIDELDEDASQVGIVTGVKQYETFGVAGSVFSLEAARVTVTRGNSDWLVFEEVSN